MAGISDIRHELCLALALWNGERPDPEGADVRPHRAAGQPRRGRQGVLVVPRGAAEPRAAAAGATTTRRPRSRTSSSCTTAAACNDPELELLDTGVFDDDRYWSVDVTYAKASPTEVLMRIERREPRARRGDARRAADAVVPQHVVVGRRGGAPADRGRRLGARRRRPPRSPATGSRRRPAPTARSPRRSSARTRRTRRASSAPTRRRRTRRTASTTTSSRARPPSTRTGFGTKAALRYRVTVPGRRQGRAAAAAPPPGRRRAGRRPTWAGDAFDEVVAAREADADEFYAALAPDGTSTPSRCGSSARPAPGSSGASRCTRTTCAAGSTATPASRRRPSARRHGRNSGWRHLDSFDVLAMPDPWEYPWFAAWDLGFHCVAVGAPRSGVREVPAARAAARVVPAPERRAAGLRVELRRRQPAGARDGRDARVQDRRRPRPRVPRAGLPEAARQLHLVAQPRGRRRQQRVQRRLPRARQHQPDRPLEPARGRRARAGRRDGVDGLLRARRCS